MPDSRWPSRRNAGLLRRSMIVAALLGLVATLAVVAGGSAQGAAALPANPWTGQWLNSADGTTVTLAQSGSGITGTSPCPGTTMFPAGVTQTGTVSGDGTTASFTYSGAPSCPGVGGTYQATMRPDARVIDVRGTTQFGTPFTATFTYQGGGTEPRETPTPPPPPTSPSGFDETLTYPAPRPGRVKPITSPVIPDLAPKLRIQVFWGGPLGQAVSPITPVAVFSGPPTLTKAELQDLLDQRAFERAFEICYVFGDYEPEVLEALESGRAGHVLGSKAAFILLRESEAFLECVEVLTRLLRPRLPGPAALSTSAQAAGAGCGARALPLVLRKKRGSRRVTLGVGSRRQTRPRLKVDCAKTADGALTMTVRPRKRSARLRDVVGRRLRLGVGRPRSGPPAQAGDTLNVVWSLPAG